MTGSYFRLGGGSSRVAGTGGWVRVRVATGASYKTRNGYSETETKRNETNGTGNHTQNIDSAACCAELDCIFKYETPQRLNQLLSERMSDSERAYQTDL